MDHPHTMRNDKISGFAWLCILLYDRIHIVKMTDFECRFCFLSRFHKVLSVCWFGWLFCFLFLLGLFCFRKTRLCDTICQTTSPKVKEDPPPSSFRSDRPESLCLCSNIPRPSRQIYPSCNNTSSAPYPNLELDNISQDSISPETPLNQEARPFFSKDCTSNKNQFDLTRFLTNFLFYIIVLHYVE